MRIKKLPDPDLWLSVALDQWEWEYSLSVSFIVDRDPLDEGDTLYITGTTPAKAKGELLNVRLKVLGFSALRPEKRSGTKQAKVGTLRRVRGGYEGFLAAPDTAIPTILVMLQHNRYRRVELSLLKVARLEYEVQGYYFKHALSGD